jgi:hypothetical protein
MYFDIYEFTYKNFRSAVNNKVRSRSKTLPSGTTFVDMNKSGTINFKTESQTFPGTGLFWDQSIKLLDLPLVLVLKDPNLTPLDRVKLAITGDLAVTCNCPSLRYHGYAYILSQLDSKLGRKEKRFPVVRNPELSGVVCKHLDSALVTLPFHVNDLVAYIKDMI